VFAFSVRDKAAPWIGHAAAELLYTKILRVPALNLSQRYLRFFARSPLTPSRGVRSVDHLARLLPKNKVPVGVGGFVSATRGKLSLECIVLEDGAERPRFNGRRVFSLHELDVCVSSLAEKVSRALVKGPIPAIVRATMRKGEYHDLDSARLLGLACGMFARGESKRREAHELFRQLTKHDPTCGLGRFLWAYTGGPKVFIPDECMRILRLNPCLIQAYFCDPLFNDEPLQTSRAKFSLYRRGLLHTPYSWHAFAGFRELCVRLNRPLPLIQKALQLAEVGTFYFAEAISTALYVARRMHAEEFASEVCQKALKYAPTDTDRKWVMSCAELVGQKQIAQRQKMP